MNHDVNNKISRILHFQSAVQCFELCAFHTLLYPKDLAIDQLRRKRLTLKDNSYEMNCMKCIRIGSQIFSFVLQTWMPTHLDNSAPFFSKLVIDLFKYYITLNKENTSEYVLGTCMYVILLTFSIISIINFVIFYFFICIQTS